MTPRDLPEPPTVREVLDDILEKFTLSQQERRARGVIHEIRVTPHLIPNGFTWVWRTDGERTLYVSHPVWEWMPRQSYGGIPLIEVPDEHRSRGYALTAIPVYKEPGCPA